MSANTSRSSCLRSGHGAACCGASKLGAVVACENAKQAAIVVVFVIIAIVVVVASMWHMKMHAT